MKEQFDRMRAWPAAAIRPEVGPATAQEEVSTR